MWLVCFAAAILMLGVCSGTGLAAAVPQADVTIDLHAKGRNENPHMWGIFLEDVNNCVDGGLYAQLIRNPDFQNDVPPQGCKVVGAQWRLPNGNTIQPPQGGPLYGWKPATHHPLRLKLLRKHPLSPAHPLSLRLTAPVGGSGVINSGYWGMNVVAGRNYRLSFYASSPAPSDQALTAQFINASGRRLGPPSVIRLSGSGWRGYETTLRVSHGNPTAELKLSLAHAGSVDINIALLFPVNPQTGRIQIFRTDLLRLLQNLKPGFLRFPGGNYVEGVCVGDSYNWRQTVGPMINRPGHFNCWGYRNTDGFGFLQYLELCRRLRAVPLYGTFAGEPLGFFYPVNPVPSVSGKALDPYIRRMLTAVAFANDPITSRWGALRAKYGHPLPFGLKYVELGNENGGPMYVKNAMRMAAALAKHFPQVIPIRTAWSARLARVVPLGDEHYYASPDMFYVDSTEFNHRPRHTPVRSFVGEYAVIGHCRKHGDMRGALAEAAYMIGMERNCDVVRMASYAPLFKNCDGYQWQPDLIEFNTHQAFGRSSYWVQWMFSHHVPATVYPAHVTAEFHPSTGGRIALETQACRAQFSAIRVSIDGRDVMHTGPKQVNGGLLKWRTVTWHAGWGPNWRMHNGILTQSDRSSADDLTAFGRLDWKNYTLRLRFEKLAGPGGVTIWVRRDPAGLNGAELRLGGPKNNEFQLIAVHDRRVRVLKSSMGQLRVAKWYAVKIVLHGQRVAAYLNGRHLFSAVVHDTPPRFFADAGISPSHHRLIIKLDNTLGYQMPSKITFDGPTRVGSHVRVVTLGVRRDTEENSFQHPLLISPRVSTYHIPGPVFTYRCPPYSLTVLEISVR